MMISRLWLQGPRAALERAKIASERAALALYSTKPSKPENPTVTFLIPLVGRHQVGDWTTIEARLAETLASFARQSSPNWQALICGQDAPSVLPDDPRVVFVPFEKAVEGNDKWDKLRHLFAALKATPHQGYAMPFDADDLAHENLVKHLVTSRPSGGALVTQGLVQNLGTQDLALARPQSLLQPGQKAFWKLCGSSAAFRWDSTAECLTFLTEATQHEHRMFPYLSKLAGRPLQAVPFPAALYALNHGENFGPRRGRVAFKARFAQRFAVKDAGQKAEFLAPFGL